MVFGSYVGYLNFVIILFVATGGWIVRFDAKRYARDGMKKEQKAALFIGWLNIVLGAMIFVANWIYQQWFFFRW
ncbi:MAG TPA: CLC_0170 family protein [Paenibacillus sp.]|uniref:CLC_0170 family protein n=1 Tax=Paenibacillus sp. TaxID=58172 RepID=UPI0028D7E236|nr:CLC_0170 family protein [Paenibacillus sp.]HUC93069.1 CLC_0170 family protein [Paenibacillus sp.]